MRYLLILLLLAGCASYEETHMPDGRPGYSINCGRWKWNTPGECYEIAGKLCGERGYDIVARSEGTLVLPDRNRAFVVACKS